ncbi:MAG: class I SAM-dependent methyltransferase [Patescibacteria group bacterium]
MIAFYEHEPAGARKMEIIKDILEKEEENKGKKLRVLDVGCGDGHLSAYMASLGHQVSAIDTDASAIETAKSLYNNVNFLNSDLSVVKDKFDVVTAFEVCEHVPDEKNFTEQMREKLSENGLLVISVPNGWSLEEIVRRFLQNSSVGRSIKNWMRKKNVLPKSESQTHADSPHVHFWRYYTWKKNFARNNFKFLCSWNVSLFFKQLYYLGFRRFLKPAGAVFKFLDKFDGKIVNLFPSWMVDGWLMTFRK